MQVNLPPTVSLSIAPSAAPSAAGWQIGQSLTATVLSQTSPGQYLLDIGGRRYQAESPQTLATGQVLQVKVAALNPRPLLQVAAPASPLETIATALRIALPRQETLSALFASLANTAALNPARGAVLPEPASALVKQLFLGLASTRQASDAAGLQEALRNAGLFLESKLAAQAGGSAPAPLGDDLKANLLRLLAALRGTSAEQSAASAPRPVPPTAAGTPETVRPDAAPGARGAAAAAQPATDAVARSIPAPALQALAEQVDAALARVQLGQIASLPQGEGTDPSWLFELPIRRDAQHVDLFQIRFTQQRRDSAQPPFPWTVTLAFDLTGLGPVQAQLTLAGARLAAFIWAEQAHTAALFNRHLDRLRTRMGEAGLTLGELRCVHGSAPFPIGEPPFGQTRLLDVNA